MIQNLKFLKNFLKIEGKSILFIQKALIFYIKVYF